MPDNKIQEVFGDWKAKIVLWVSVISGFLALFVSGYIEYYFFKSILQDFVLLSFLIVFVIETAKMCAIVFHRFIENRQSRSLILPSRVIFFNRLVRVVLILFSLICAFSKISEFMESPLLEQKWKEKKTEINVTYDNKYKSSETLLNERVNSAKTNIDTFMNRMTSEDKLIARNIGRVKNEFGLYKIQEIAKTNAGIKSEQLKFLQADYDNKLIQRDNALEKIEYNRDSTLSSAYTLLKDSKEVQSPLIVGIYTMFNKAGYANDFKIFQARFVLIIALFTTTLLELIILNTFNYLTLVYLLGLTKDEYDENTYFPNRLSVFERIRQFFRRA